jgi:pheromone shutdown protein TraB
MVGTFNHAMELIFPVEQVSVSVSWSLSDFLSEFLLEAALLAAAYLLVALPAVRVVLCERDEQLVHGIREACRLSEKGRVVAILGLLHVNGVAKQLLTASKGRDAE